MYTRRAAALLIAGSMVFAAGCSSSGGAEGSIGTIATVAPTAPPVSITTDSGDTVVITTGSSSAPVITDDPATTTPSNANTTTTVATGGTDITTTTVVGDATTTTVDDPTTPTSQPPDPETTPTSIVPVPGVYDGACVVKVEAGESLSLIADRYEDETISVPAIRAENSIVGDRIDPGQLLDICVGNGIDDVTGDQRTEADREQAGTLVAVEKQQTRLNELFYGVGLSPLLVDGVSGPVTRQRLCAARLAFGLPTSTVDMVAGSEEEQIMMAATSLPIPYTSAILSERWVLIDQTCQIMFAGEGTTKLVWVFPTSTGLPEFPTRDQNRSRVFRYDPALENGGWHNSSSYPAAEDNPLNGNMYKPIYFDNGQAIHGANNVPTSPASHGCARLRLEYQ
ncbi:MAG: LysM peptidoglycan-binding domain-containing protein, partial [Ilumatobacteraceae bacterium]